MRASHTKKSTKRLSLLKAFRKKPALFAAISSIALVVVIGSLTFALNRPDVSMHSVENNNESASTHSSPATASKDVMTVNSSETSEARSQSISPSPSASPSASSKSAASTSSAPKNTSSSPAAPQSYGTVAPNPYCPAPTFTINVTRQSSSNYNLFVTPVSDPTDPSLTPACGGGINFSTPKVGYPASGPFCSGLTYPIGNNNWGVACSIYGNASYGDYTFTFTITGTNGFNKSTTHSASYTYHYIQE